MNTRKDIRRSYKLAFSFLVLFGILACGVSTPQSQPISTSGGATSAPGTQPPPTIQHSMVPVNLPSSRSGHAGDQDSSVTARQKKAPGGDKFSQDMFERPFNANTMDTYFPYLDIQDTLVYEDDTWVYAVIALKGPDSNNHLSGKYGVEMDLNLDGRGDFLIVASQPVSTDWTTDGVQVWQDANHDVGGNAAVVSDKNSSGDGFETNVFDSGHGSDPDSAYARLAPDNPDAVQIAAKRALFGGAKSFMVGMWAGADSLNPALFDINDHFTSEQAGSPLSDLSTYPIKAVAELDNACRMAVGFQPSGKEPGLCASSSQACKPPAGGCSQGYAWNAAQCCCMNVDGVCR